MIIDAHVHLWETQKGIVNGRPVVSAGGGKSDFGGELRQMLPPYLLDDRNTAEYLLSNMDYAGVSCAVVTQEYIDGNQNAYVCKVRAQHPSRFRVCSLYEETGQFALGGFDGIKICGSRLRDADLLHHADVFRAAAKKNKFISIDMADGALQAGALRELAQEFPALKIAIGHFGMAARPDWPEQVKLARLPNVYLESGGITWLYHQEFYPYPSAVRAIRQAAELCGIEKLMWGSDYPRTMTAITYLMSLDFVQKSDVLNTHEKELFLGENARAFYGLEALSAPPRIRNMVED